MQYLLYLTGEIAYKSQKPWHSISCTLETKITKGTGYTASILNFTHPQGVLFSKTQVWFFFNVGIKIWMYTDNSFERNIVNKSAGVLEKVASQSMYSMKPQLYCIFMEKSGKYFIYTVNFTS